MHGLSIAAAGGLLLWALIIHAQSAQLPSFEAVSVKPHGPGGRTSLMLPTALPGGRFVSKFSVSSVISFAYKLPINPSPRLAGVPDWARAVNDVYDIEAIGVMPAGLSTQARTDRMMLMVQALLADRFKLAIHRASKTMPLYELVVEKGGPKLQPADIQERDCPVQRWPGTRASRARRRYVRSGEPCRGLYRTSPDRQDRDQRPLSNRNEGLAAARLEGVINHRAFLHRVGSGGLMSSTTGIRQVATPSTGSCEPQNTSFTRLAG